MEKSLFFTFLGIFTLSIADALDSSAEIESCKSQADQLRDDLLSSIGKTLDSQTTHYCRQRPKDKVCLKAVKNLSDVEDKEEALKNIGVEGNFTRVYTATIDLTGLSITKFYPVWWQFNDQIGGNSISIFRYYAENANLNPFGDNDWHVAGLNLQLKGNDIPWGGGAHYMKIEVLSQTYRKTVKNIKFGMLTVARKVDNLPLYNNYNDGAHVSCSRKSGLFLRGGLTYHARRNFVGSFGYSRKDEEIQIDSSVQSGWGIKWMVKSYAEGDPLLGGEYNDAGLAIL